MKQNSQLTVFLTESVNFFLGFPKVFRAIKVVFHKNSNGNLGLFVNFPSFRFGQGLVSKVEIPAGKINGGKLSLISGGKISTHLVKYSHWEDGSAKFSQDGKVVSSHIRTKSFPLTQNANHIFTVMLQGPEGFKDSRIPSTVSTKRVDLKFNFESVPEAVKITGWWFLPDEIVRLGGVGPQLMMQVKDGSIKKGFLIAPPSDWEVTTGVLFVAAEMIPKIDSGNKISLSFIGGFETNIGYSDLPASAMLAFIYPADNVGELEKQLGTIDFKG